MSAPVLAFTNPRTKRPNEPPLLKKVRRLIRLRPDLADAGILHKLFDSFIESALKDTTARNIDKPVITVDCDDRGEGA